MEAAYINGNLASNLEYKPSFISNNPEEGKKVISSIEEELLRCEQFQISVAFITMGGITPLLQTLKELERKRIPGQILTTNYLDFSEPRALAKLNELKNRDSLTAQFDKLDVDIGDIVGGKNRQTGVTMKEVISSEIVKIKNDRCTVTYKVGE